MTFGQFDRRKVLQTIQQCLAHLAVATSPLARLILPSHQVAFASPRLSPASEHTTRERFRWLPAVTGSPAS